MFPYGDRLRDQRKKLKMTQEVFAKLGGVTVQTQRNYESGRRAPDTEYLNKIADKGVDVQYIVTSPEDTAIIRMPNFGTVTGLKFDDGGYAEVRMGSPEVARILDALLDYESEQDSPDEKILEKLKSVRSHYFDRSPELLAEVVIGAYRVKFNWVPREE